MSSNFNLTNYSLDEIDSKKLYFSKEFKENYLYKKNDLGIILEKNSTSFKLWAPIATKVFINFYKDSFSDSLIYTKEMTKKDKGIFYLKVDENLNGIYYTFSVENFGSLVEVVDPYAKAVGVNGKRGLIIDLSHTNPENWKEDKVIKLKNKTDAIIYEVHMKDFSTYVNSGIKNKGKFLSFTEKNTKNRYGDITGISHLKELGITHVHLLPVYDFESIDESIKNNNSYNWGYDPQNYNCIEGSYSSDAFNGYTRIKEFKELIKALHKENIGVIMDVVYNHTYDSENSNLNKIVPHYYHRCNEKGKFSNGSGCGNEIATEKFMVRKFIIDSVCYLASEYHLDGFRFDLMGLMDIETMNQLQNSLEKINPNIILYGEGWQASKSLLNNENSASKLNAYKLSENIGCFSDDIRDSMRGSFTNKTSGGFVSNISGYAESVRFGIVSSVFHPQIDYNKPMYSKKPWAQSPSQCINYNSSHDDETIFDRLTLSNKNASKEKLIFMNKMCAMIVLTSQGIPFLHAGEEFLRTKRDEKGNIFHNTYNMCEKINEINWDEKSKNKEIFNYYKGLIKLRKNHEAFRMPTKELISKHLKFIDNHNEDFIGYFINDYKNDKWKNIGVFLNPTEKDFIINLNKPNWIIVLDNNNSSEKSLGEINSNILNLKSFSQLIIVDKESFNK